MVGPYFRTQREKDEYEAKMREVYANMPTLELPKSQPTAHKPKPKKHRKPHPGGFRLGDVMPQELKDKAYAYRRRQNRAKLGKSNNHKGDQYYGKRRQNTRPTNTGSRSSEEASSGN